ncbi:MAG: hypothetical protein JKY98_05290 [Gammaproteobacteria bacterium]|nr:hypothetical protein [Gammaproteobacteria bacterium]
MIVEQFCELENDAERAAFLLSLPDAHVLNYLDAFVGHIFTGARNPDEWGDKFALDYLDAKHMSMTAVRQNGHLPHHLAENISMARAALETISCPSGKTAAALP